VLIVKRSILEKPPDPLPYTTRATLSAVGKHLRDTGHKLEESKAAVIARKKTTLEGEFVMP